MSKILNPFDGDISDKAILAWLEQFDQKDKPVILKLISSFNYYSSRKVADFVKKLYIMVNSALEKLKGKIWFVPVGYVAKSGSIIAYYFRTQNGLPQDCFIAPSDLGSLNLNNEDAIVFLDDFVGTGNQACQVWQNVVVPLKNTSDCRFVYAVLVGYEKGLENIQASKGFIPIAVEVLTENDMPFSPHGILFKDEDEKKHAREVVKKYGLRLYPNHPLGYNETQGLIGFFYSTPNNTLPIFWSTEASWKPILAHGESFRDPAYLIGPPPGLTRESASDSPVKPLIDSQELDRYDIDTELAIKIFSEFQKPPIFLVLAPILKVLNIGNEVFSEILQLITELKYYEHEKQPVCSAIFIIPNNVSENLIGSKMLSAGTQVSTQSVDEVRALANLVDGYEGAVVFRFDGKALGNFLYQKEEYQDERFLPNKYHYAAAASLRSSGLLFLFSGNGRVTAFYNGQRILSHRLATWHLHTTELERGIRNLSSDHGIDIPIFQEIFRLCFRLSDDGKGALITVGDHDTVISYSDPPKTEFLHWVDMKLGETPDEAILGLIVQDGATIVSGSGNIVQGMTFLRPPAGTDAAEEVGRGSKHSTASKISKVTNAVCIAVSVDGRITVYSRGAISFKMMA